MTDDDFNNDSQNNADRNGGLDEPLPSDSSSPPTLQYAGEKFFSCDGERKIWTIMLLNACIKSNIKIKELIETIYIYQKQEYEVEGITFDTFIVKRTIELFVYNKIRYLKRLRLIHTSATNPYSLNFGVGHYRIIKKLQPKILEDMLKKLERG